MEIKINIDESLFDSVIAEEIKAIPKEDIQKIIKDCIKERLNSKTEDGKNILESFFFEKKNNYGYGYSAQSTTPSDLMIKILQNIDYSDVVNEVKESVIDYVKNNKRTLTNDVIYNFISNGLTRTFCDNEFFKMELRNAIDYEISRRNENK